MDRLKKLKLNSRRNLLLIFLLVLALLAIGIFTANLQARSYETSSKKWNESLRSNTTVNNAPSFSNKIVIGSLETDEQSRVQKTDCDANTKRLNWFKEHSKGPSVGWNPLGIFSSSYREAQKDYTSQRDIEKTVRQSILKMSEYQNLCEFYIAAVDITKTEIKDTQVAKQYKLYEGTDQQLNQPCSVNGCLPEDRAVWPKLADIYKAYVISAKNHASLYKDKCFSDTYKKVCELNVQYFSQKATNQEMYNNAIRKGSSLYAGINSKLDKKYDALIRDAYKSVKGTKLPETGDPESTVQKSIMIDIEKSIDGYFKTLQKL